MIKPLNTRRRPYDFTYGRSDHVIDGRKMRREWQRLLHSLVCREENGR